MFTYGFYNSLNHDRVYDARTMSSIFDGIINDGIFQNIGTAMIVTEASGMTVNVGIGRAWFNSTWSLNDSIMPVTIGPSLALLSRIDAVVLEVNNTNTVRANSIKVVPGTPSSTPVRPTLLENEEVHQHALAYIFVGPGATEIPQSAITNVVGTDETPFITGILKTLSAENLYLQWQSEYEAIMATNDSEFQEWFTHLHNELDEHQAANLQRQIDELNDKVGDGILSSKEEIVANTEYGYIADAMVTKEMINNLIADDGLEFKFGMDGDGNYGYYGADGSLIPFKRGGSGATIVWTGDIPNAGTLTIDLSSLSDYRLLTTENFIVEPYVILSSAGAQMTENQTLTTSTTSNFTKSYDPVTGKLTLSGARAYKNYAVTGVGYVTANALIKSVRVYKV